MDPELQDLELEVIDADPGPRDGRCRRRRVLGRNVIWRGDQQRHRRRVLRGHRGDDRQEVAVHLDERVDGVRVQMSLSVTVTMAWSEAEVSVTAWSELDTISAAW